MQDMGIIFALLSALFQGFGYVSLKKSYRHLKPSLGFALDALWGLLIWIPFSLISGISIPQIPHVLPYAFLSALLSEAFVFFALSRGEISLTGTLFATYPIYTILFSRFINHDQLTLIQWFTVALVIIGTLIVTLPKRMKKISPKHRPYLLWPILAALAVGISDSLSKHVIDQTDAPTFLFCLSLTQIPVAISYLWIEFRHKQLTFHRQINNILRQPMTHQYALAGSLSNVLCVLCLWLSFGTTFASIASPLTASYPLYIVVFARLMLREKIPAKNWPGIALILENTVLLALITSVTVW